MKKKSRYIDFKQVKQQVSMEQILRHYDMLDELKGGGNALSGDHCPLCEAESGGIFRVSLDKNCWNCFGECNGGNILDLVSQMEGCSIREAAVQITDWFGIECVAPGRKTAGRKRARKKAHADRGNASGEKPQYSYNPEQTDEPSGSPGANKPLGFELDLDPEHPWFQEICLGGEAVREFGLGYCGKGFLKDHIAFPIHNWEGEIVAYGGMSMDGDDPHNPEYRYPDADKFDPSQELFGLYQALRQGDTGVVYLVRTPLQVFQSWHNDGVSAVCPLAGVSAGALGRNFKELLTNCLM